MTVKVSNHEIQFTHLLVLILFAILLALALIASLDAVGQTLQEFSAIVDAGEQAVRTTNYIALPLAA